VDNGPEVFVWTGTASRAQDRKLAWLLAALLAQRREERLHFPVVVTRILEKGETILFKVRSCCQRRGRFPHGRCSDPPF